MILNNLNHITYKNSDLLNSSFLLFLTMLLGIITLSAQKPHCHADEILHQHLAEKGLQHQHKEYIQNLKNIVPDKDGGQVLRIPIVVHVIHSGETIGSGSNLSNAKIMEQLKILNDDFNQLNTDRNQIPSEFASIAANTEIEFCLAQTNPGGQSSTGIVRNQFNSISGVNFIENNIKPQTQWDPTRYMNLWIIRMPNPNILGYSYLPTPDILNSSLDGVVISHLKIGNQNSSTKGRTLVHEVGHYLGLPHLWGANEGDCTEDDQISDTPSVRTPYFGHPAHPQFTCGTSDMFMNFMDYVDDNCMFMFTEGQKVVMRSVINNQRASLLSNNDTECNSVVSTNANPARNDLVKMFPNPCQEDLNFIMPDNQTIKELRIFDSSGKMIENQYFTNKTGATIQHLNTNSLQNGIFIMRLETHTGAVYVKRFVKLAK